MFVLVVTIMFLCASVSVIAGFLTLFVGMITSARYRRVEIITLIALVVFEVVFVVPHLPKAM